MLGTVAISAIKGVGTAYLQKCPLKSGCLTLTPFIGGYKTKRPDKARARS